MRQLLTATLLPPVRFREKSLFSYLRGPECTGSAGCDDGNACTVDTCINGLCSHAPVCSSDAQCSNGIACNGAERCDASGCCVPGTPPDCNDGVSCTADTCTEPLGACQHVPVQALCDDGLYCTGVETCDVVQGCQPGTSVNCDDAIACTEDFCVEATRSCDHVPRHELCDDHLFCDGRERCDVVQGCVAGDYPCGTLGCNDAKDICVCDSNDDCSPPAEPCRVAVCRGETCAVEPAQDGQACDDGLFCTVSEACLQGICTNGVPRECPAGLPCDEATDICRSGCNPPDCSDGDPCTTDSCVNGSCVHAPIACCSGPCPVCGNAVCEAGETPSSCPQDCCQTKEVPKSTCTDRVDNDCDGKTDCQDTDCAADPSCTCDDKNPCTNDAIVNGVCQHTNNTAACDDANACTDGDICASGRCVGTPIECDDGKACDPRSGSCVCEDDADGDGVCDDVDLCPNTPDSTNADADGDGIGNVCDNCPDAPNDDQGDQDGDGIGDLCEDPVGPQPVCTQDAECDDEDLCTDDACVGSECVYTPIECSEGQMCDPDTGDCVCARDEACNDGDLCTVDECKDVNGDGVPGCVHSPVDCPGSQTCDPDTGNCVGGGSNCPPGTCAAFCPAMLIGLPLSLVLWMGVRGYSRRRG